MGILAKTHSHRFVTGLVDNGQTGRSKVNMFQVATRIGLPKSFVELRHQATHEELPGLLVLRQAADRSLKWLWHYYWRNIDERTGSLDDVDGISEQALHELKDRLVGLLRAYRIDRVEATKASRKLDTSKTNDQDATKRCKVLVQEIIKLLKDRETAVKGLANVLLEVKYLIPANRTLGESIDNALLLWDNFLMGLSNWQPSFLHIMVDQMASLLVEPSKLDVQFDAYREAIYLWLVHILTTEAWAAQRQQGLTDYASVVSKCIAGPNHWSLKLAALLVRLNQDVQDRYGEVVRLALGRQERDQEQARELEAIKAEVRHFDAALDQVFDGHDTDMDTETHNGSRKSLSGEAGWLKWEGPWASKPIGMVD
ncbi:MAG: rRNA-processing protein las1 [Candelina mexicana]|nr:MAG: rRNA-processing protein las1 [Candelina mexicana]